MNKIIDELKKLTEEVADAKTNVAILESKKEDAMKKLQTDFKLKSVAAGELLVSQKTAELSELEELIREKFTKLKEAYQW